MWPQRGQGLPRNGTSPLKTKDTYYTQHFSVTFWISYHSVEDFKPMDTERAVLHAYSMEALGEKDIVHKKEMDRRDSHILKVPLCSYHSYGLE